MRQNLAVARSFTPMPEKQRQELMARMNPAKIGRAS
jgi:hypothetical protein